MSVLGVEVWGLWFVVLWFVVEGLGFGVGGGGVEVKGAGMKVYLAEAVELLWRGEGEEGLHGGRPILVRD